MNIEVVCDNCGKTFVCKHKSRLNYKNLFCCKKCEGEYRKRQNLNMTCPICGKKFHAKPSHIAKAKHEMSKEAHTQYHMHLRKLASQNLVKSVKPKS